MSTTIYGIKNCDTMKKALAWLEDQSIAFTFHDYKKSGVDEDVLRTALDEHGWEHVINRKGTTWRQLPENIKNSMNVAQAIKIACDNPSIIKRPLLTYKNKTYLGFKNEQYSDIFGRKK